MKFDRYTQNLRFEHPFVISYTTKVAEVKGDEIHPLNWKVVDEYGNAITSSPTTSKHINYVATQLNLKLIK